MPKPVKAPLPDLGYIAETVRGSQPGRALDGARSLPLDRIDPNPAQARQSFDEQALQELAASITTHGVIEPVVVRPVGERYQIVAGERRTRAARIAGLTSIPAIIREYTDEQAAYITAVENLQREGLDIEDEARQYQALQKITGLSGRALAKQLGKGPDYINRRLLLLRYPDVMEAIRAGIMTQREGLETANYRASLPDDTIFPTPWDEPSEEELTHGASVRPEDSTPAPVERAELDTPEVRTPHSEPRTRPAPSSDRLVRTPWRDRPLTAFMTWVARVDVTTVPAQERARAREQLAAAREWIDQLEAQLGEATD